MAAILKSKAKLMLECSPVCLSPMEKTCGVGNSTLPYKSLAAEGSCRVTSYVQQQPFFFKKKRKKETHGICNVCVCVRALTRVVHSLGLEHKACVCVCAVRLHTMM